MINEYWVFEPDKGWVQVVPKLGFMMLQVMNSTPEKYEGFKLAVVERETPYGGIFGNVFIVPEDK